MLCWPLQGPIRRNIRFQDELRSHYFEDVRTLYEGFQCVFISEFDAWRAIAISRTWLLLREHCQLAGSKISLLPLSPRQP